MEYFFSLLSIIQVNSNQNSIEVSKVDIFILSNGVHTDIVVPVKNDSFNWSKTN